jgi:hypothetical protein
MKIGGFILGFAAGLACGVGVFTLLRQSDDGRQNQPLAAMPATNTVVAGAPTKEPQFSSGPNQAVAERIRLAAVGEKSVLAREFEEIAQLEDAQKRERLLGKFFQAWVVRDAAGAAEFALGIAGEELRRKALLQVASHWAIQDPDAALKWAQDAKYETDYERQMATSMICTAVAQTDPKEALRLAQEHRLDEQNDEVLPNLARRWAEVDLPAARDWAEQQPAGEKRDAVMLSIAATMVNSNPTRAAKFILEQIPPGESQDQAVFSILPQWASVDLRGATAWAELFPEGPLRDRAQEALDGVMNRFQDDDP